MRHEASLKARCAASTASLDVLRRAVGDLRADFAILRIEQREILSRYAGDELASDKLLATLHGCRRPFRGSLFLYRFS